MAGVRHLSLIFHADPHNAVACPATERLLLECGQAQSTVPKLCLLDFYRSNGRISYRGDRQKRHLS